MSDYAATTDLPLLGVASEALTEISTPTQQAVIAARSRFADGYLRSGGYIIPDGGLVAFTGDLTWAVVQLSCYDLVSNHGYATSPDNQENLRKRHDDAIKWLEQVRDGKIDLQLPAEDDEPSDRGVPLVVSDRPRGWTDRHNRLWGG
jgi:phage gp36-like protein